MNSKSLIILVLCGFLALQMTQVEGTSLIHISKKKNILIISSLIYGIELIHALQMFYTWKILPKLI